MRVTPFIQSASVALVSVGVITFQTLAWAQPNAPGKKTLTWSPTKEEGWKPVNFGDLYVKPGSALDFSGLVEEGPAGKHGFVIVNERGELAFEKDPKKSVRFFTCSDGMEYFRPQTPDEITAYAEQVRLAGYNCFRPHFLDLMLMINTTEDCVFNLEQLDRWDRLSAELKKRGIYLYFDISTSAASYYAMPRQGANGEKGAVAHNLSARLFWDPKAREHWEKATRLLLEHVNPYTGVALKDEQQVLLFQLRNESGMHCLFRLRENNGHMDAGLLVPFHIWLEKQYTDIAALNSAWGTQHKHFEEVPFPGANGISPSAVDLQRFIVDTEVETFHWLKAAIAKVGVRALALDYNVGVEFAHNLTRSAMPLVDSHAYHDHPSHWVSPGSSQPNSSSVEKGLEYFAWLNDVRQLDRPFIVSEWGFPYWNQWRYESGLGVPAYASLQGYQLLTQHSAPIREKAIARIRPFDVAYDPPCKVAERMAALLYAREDVKPSTHTVEIRLDSEGVFSRFGGNDYLPLALRKLPLLVRTGIRVVDFPDSLPGARVHSDAAMRIHPNKPAIVWTDDPGLTSDQTSETPGPIGLVSYLKKRGLLPEGNKTEPVRGIYQSDTGQLALDMIRKTIAIDTPRSQAVALPAGSSPIVLSDLKVTNHGNSGAVFVGSLDGKPLNESKRILIMVVGDALNSGTVFEDKSRKVLKEMGSAPVLVNPMDMEIGIHRPLLKSNEVHLWALAFNGDRIEEVPIERSGNGWLRTRINTDTYSSPSFYFELTMDDQK